MGFKKKLILKKRQSQGMFGIANKNRKPWRKKR
jgi:hypothetical protein